MASKVDICNLALANIRAQSINSLAEASKEAQYCKLKYDFVLDFMLRDSPWAFARKQVALDFLTNELFEWVYTYQYPSDCLRINRLLSSINRLSQSSEGNAVRPDYYDDNPLNDYSSRLIQIPYDTLILSDTRVIGANEPELWIDYQFRVVDPNQFDSLFTMAFCWYFAAELAMPIIGGDNGRKERQAALEMYSMTLKEAQAVSANEKYQGKERESDFILARS